MTTDAVQALFVEEWEQLATSTEFRRTLRRWRAESDGVIVERTATELLAAVQHPTDHRRSRAVASWLLARDEPLARRVLVQASHRLVLSQIKRSRLRSSDLRDWSQSCVAALLLAVGRLSGRVDGWPMWAIRREFIAELKVLSVEYKFFGSEIPESRTGTPEHVDPAVALGQVLSDAVSANSVSECDAQILWLTATGLETNAEVATRLGVQPSTVRKRHTRTVRAVAQLMAA